MALIIQLIGLFLLIGHVAAEHLTLPARKQLELSFDGLGEHCIKINVSNNNYLRLRFEIDNQEIKSNYYYYYSRCFSLGFNQTLSVKIGNEYSFSNVNYDLEIYSFTLILVLQYLLGFTIITILILPPFQRLIFSH